MAMKKQVEKKMEPCRFKAGDLAQCNFRPMHYTIPDPVRIENVERGNCMSGYLCEIITKEGSRVKVDSHKFRPYK